MSAEACYLRLHCGSEGVSRVLGTHLPTTECNILENRNLNAVCNREVTGQIKSYKCDLRVFLFVGHDCGWLKG